MPRYALISDIHGNLEAFHAVLRDIALDHIDQILCLGDLVGYGPEPGACIELAFTVCDRIVIGNHDEAVLDATSTDDFNPRALASIQITRDLLDHGHRQMLATLPRTERIGELAITHGSFGSDHYEYLYNQRAAVRSLGGLKHRYGAVGHTHVPCAFACPITEPASSSNVFGEQLVRDIVRPLPMDSKVLLNPGSVGQPRDRNPDASWAVLDTERRTFQIRRVEYDVDRVSQQIAGLGLPEFHAERLRVGA